MFCSIERFAQIYAAKLDMNPSVLRKTLWGDFYLETKTKRIKKGAQVSHVMYSVQVGNAFICTLSLGNR